MMRSHNSNWVIRVSEVKARAAVNLEAERRAVQFNDEIQALVRNLKSKDQGVRESSVKIELMKRRIEAVKKQADTINDPESELGKARKKETLGSFDPIFGDGRLNRYAESEFTNRFSYEKSCLGRHSVGPVRQYRRCR